MKQIKRVLITRLKYILFFQCILIMHLIYNTFNNNATQSESERTMKTKKAIATKVKKQEINNERERVLYRYEKKCNCIIAQFKSNIVKIAKQDIIELFKRADDRKKFYAYCNADLKLLRKLDCDAQAKKAQRVKNTQYDSRKKLLALVLQIAVTELKQKAKKQSKKQKAVKN